MTLEVTLGIFAGTILSGYFLLWWWLRGEIDKLQALAVLSRREQSTTVAKVNQAASSMQQSARQLQQEARMLSWHISNRG